MAVESKALANSIGDEQAVEKILKDEGGQIELQAIEADAIVNATENLTRYKQKIQSNVDLLQNYTINISISDTQAAREAIPELLPTLANATLDTPPVASPSVGVQNLSPVSISPTVGGMGLGLVGGVGLGITIDALRNTASSGNPVIGSIAIGLGLLGTAVGGYLGSGGELKFKGFGVEVSAENKNL